MKACFMKDRWSWAPQAKMGIKESGEMKKEICPRYNHLDSESIKILLWNSTLGNIKCIAV